MSGYRIGIDVGGTFTDVVAWDGAQSVETLKVPTTPASPCAGVLAGLEALSGAARAEASVAHGTTMVTNAITEGRLARTALVTTRGFRDVLEIARQNRRHLYRLDVPAKADPLVPRHLRLEVAERVGPDGAVLRGLDPSALPGLVATLEAEGVEAVAVCLLHAYANAAHERALGDALARRLRHVSLSSAVNAEFREYERSVTTVLNAAVMPLAARYLDELRAGLAGAGGVRSVSVLASSGGMMSLEAARQRPVAMAVSGPAAGVAAAAHLAEELGGGGALAFDMGGTTTDVCLVVDGRAETVEQRSLGGHPVRLSSVAVESIGAGGGSVAWSDAAGGLKVGPRSAGAEPGPACYGRGGQEPTVTDANLVLGYLNPERVYGRAIRLDRGRAEAAIARLGARYGMTVLEAAAGIVEVANAMMLRALRLVSVQRGHDVRGFALIAYGGAGPLHAARLAHELGMPRVVVPALSGAFSAWGCLVADPRHDAVRTLRFRLSGWDARRLRDTLVELEDETLAPLLADGYAREQIELLRRLDLRYEGQNYELEVPLDGDDPAGARARFEARHRRLYGYATGEEIECVNVRVSAVARRPPARLPASAPPGPAQRLGAGRAYFAGAGEVTVERWDRATLPAGLEIGGPAIVEDAWSTTVIDPGQRCRADAQGNLVIEVAP